MHLFVTPRLKILTLIAATALAILAFLPGCASTPTEKWAHAQIALNTVENSLVDLNAHGVLDDKDFTASKKFVYPARAALDEAASKLPDGGGTFTALLDEAKAAIAEAQRIESAARASQPKTAARPPPAK